MLNVDNDAGITTIVLPLGDFALCCTSKHIFNYERPGPSHSYFFTQKGVGLPSPLQVELSRAVPSLPTLPSLYLGFPGQVCWVLGLVFEVQGESHLPLVSSGYRPEQSYVGPA